MITIERKIFSFDSKRLREFIFVLKTEGGEGGEVVTKVSFNDIKFIGFK